MRCRTGSQWRTSIIRLYQMTWGHPGRMFPHNWETPRLSSIITVPPFPQYFGSPNILHKSTPVSGDMIIMLVFTDKARCISQIAIKTRQSDSRYTSIKGWTVVWTCSNDDMDKSSSERPVLCRVGVGLLKVRSNILASLTAFDITSEMQVTMQRAISSWSAGDR